MGHHCNEDRKLSTTNYDYEYWPFPVSDADTNAPDYADKISFLKSATEVGAESYKFGMNNYGAKTTTRSGIILERGRRRWEIRLSEDEVRRLSAFTQCFAVAGASVKTWLQGNTVSCVLEQLREHLVVPPGLSESYVVHESEED